MNCKYCKRNFVDSLNGHTNLTLHTIINHGNKVND